METLSSMTLEWDEQVFNKRTVGGMLTQEFQLHPFARVCPSFQTI